MSEDQVPEWLRLKREVEALVRGAWTAINALEERVTKLERDVERSSSKPVRWPRDGWWGNKPPGL